ncbi:MAG: DUF1573 domain-containing protein [Saprospiraceae bacterium]
MKFQNFLTVTLFACLMCLTMSFTADSNDEVKFVTTMHNFNQIQQGTPVTTTFKFTNHSTKPLIIKSVKPSCGCTTPSSPKAPILPGKSGEITVKYDAANIGQFNKSIKVNTNVSEAPMILYIKGEVVK